MISSTSTSTEAEAVAGAASSSERLFSLLRQFVRRKRPAEQCELCGLALGPEHAHLLEPATRKILCSCEACSILFDRSGSDARYRRIPRRIEKLNDFKLSDDQWESLHLP